MPHRHKVKVGTFNILHSESTEGDETLAARLPLTAQAIIAADVDVIGLQEVTRNNEHAPGDEFPQKHGFVARRLAAELAKRTGYTWEYCWSRSNPHVPVPREAGQDTTGLDDLAALNGNFPDSGDFSEGVAILSRLDIIESTAKFRRLGDRSGEVPACAGDAVAGSGAPDPACPLVAVFDSRQVLYARIDRGDGSAFDMFTTHVAHRVTTQSDVTKEEHISQALEIVDSWASHDRWPDFLVGDFNSDPNTASRYGRIIAAGFRDTYIAGGGIECGQPGDPGCSGGPPDGEESFTRAPTRAMGERIDYVFARPPGTCRLVSQDPATIGHTSAPVVDPDEDHPGPWWLWASDHLGMRATVKC